MKKIGIKKTIFFRNNARVLVMAVLLNSIMFGILPASPAQAIEVTPENAAKAGQKIATGMMHSLAVKADGTVVGWGNNWYDQINTSSLSGVVAVTATETASAVLKSDGTVVAW